MISCADYYIIINFLEIGSCVQRILDIERSGGRLESVYEGAFKIDCPSEKYQQNLYRHLEEAMDEDFPPECEYCGYTADECCCEDDD